MHANLCFSTIQAFGVLFISMKSWTRNETNGSRPSPKMVNGPKNRNWYSWCINKNPWFVKHISRQVFFWMLLISVFYDTYVKLLLPHHDCCSPVNQVPTEGLSRKSPSSFFSSFQWSKQFTTRWYIPQRSSPHDVINMSCRWKMLLIVWEKCVIVL